MLTMMTTQSHYLLDGYVLVVTMNFITLLERFLEISNIQDLIILFGESNHDHYIDAAC